MGYTPGSGATVSADDIGGGVLAQRVKVQFGADGSATDVDGAGVNGLPVAQQSKTFTGSAGANNTDLVSQDCAAYRYVSFNISGTFSATVSYQQSNDGTNWTGAYTFAAGSWSTTNASAQFVWAPVMARYFRIRTTSYTSGTVVVDGLFSPNVPPTVINANSGTPMTQTVVGASGTTIDGQSTSSATNPAVSAIAMGHAYNGSTWDRARAANSGKGTSGTGVPAAGSLGFDGTNWQALKTDTSGNVQVTPTPGTGGGWSVSSTTALSTTKVAVKASAGTFGGYMIFNPNTVESHVQVFNAASGSVTLGTTSPTYVLTIPANSAANLELTCGINHSTAITVAATTTATGSTGPTTALQATIFYK